MYRFVTYRVRLVGIVGSVSRAGHASSQTVDRQAGCMYGAAGLGWAGMQTAQAADGSGHGVATVRTGLESVVCRVVVEADRAGSFSYCKSKSRGIQTGGEAKRAGFVLESAVATA